jgi:apolipoprotein N-acyltransferase
MKARVILPWLLAALSAILLDLPFPIAGPMPLWRSIFAWFAFVPLFAAVLGDWDAGARHPLRRGALIGYLCGTIWYAANCSWVYYTVHLYGDLSPALSALILLVCAMILGGYFALFGFLLTFLRRRFNRGVALLAAPFLWVAIDLLAYHFTSVPWDQLGYSQIDNPCLTWLAAWTGVYGITFVLMLGNVVLAHNILSAWKWRRRSVWKVGALWSFVFIFGIWSHSGSNFQDEVSKLNATATLIQPNLDVSEKGINANIALQNNIATINSQGRITCQPYLLGMPEAGLSLQPNQNCIPGKSTLIVWPEAPSPLYDFDPRYRETITKLAAETHSTAIIGVMGADIGPPNANGASSYQIYNSATVTAPDGNFLGRYDKIHLVPYGEYVPYRDLFFFIKQMTQNVGDLSRGTMHKVFDTDGHRYGVFICYEAVFADEVREFAAMGAEVFVNISDDGWYGDTSAPWQHLNMARMRAIENHRWLIRDTNNGITAIIDPYGRITASIPRHQSGVLTARFGYERGTTFYTVHGDLFAYLCAILSVLLLLWAQPFRLGARSRLKQKSGLQ